jgi:hypothetical protein
MNDFNCLMQSSQIDGGGLDWDLGMILQRWWVWQPTAPQMAVGVAVSLGR